MIVNGMHILTNRRTNQTVVLTRDDLLRFLYIRDPSDWIILQPGRSA